MNRLAQCKYLSVFQHFHYINELVHTCMILTNGWHHEHVKAETRSGEEEGEHGQRKGGPSQLSDPEK